LMISTALMGPLFVAMAQQRAGNDLSSLGWLMLSAGLAGAVSSSFWGRFSDTSSRMTMALGAGMAGGLGVGCLLLIAIAPSVATTVAFYAALLFLLSVAHSGVRIGRKTHIVDLAGKDNKSEYVALSNTIIGVLLLIVGAFSGAAMAFGLEVGIAALSVLALAGAALSTRMRNVQDA
jgi:MFS family permease